MDRSRTDRKTDAGAPLRLRVPASLAVALLGASTTVALAIGGCHDPKSDPSIDASPLTKQTMDGGPGGDDVTADGSVTSDGGDPPLADAAVVVLPDAPDRPPSPDAYVPPPDAPDH